MSPGAGDAAAARAQGFDFEPLREAHLALLQEWLTRPHVAQWWQPTPTVAELREDYLLPAHADGTHAFIVHQAGRAIGFIQSYRVMGAGGGWWPDETDPGARGIDQFLADEAALGRGLGRAMIRAFLGRLFEDAAVTVVQTDPHPANERAIRCYRAAGFADGARVETPDGPALLMRCRREDFRG